MIWMTNKPTDPVVKKTSGTLSLLMVIHLVIHPMRRMRKSTKVATLSKETFRYARRCLDMPWREEEQSCWSFGYMTMFTMLLQKGHVCHRLYSTYI